LTNTWLRRNPTSSSSGATNIGYWNISHYSKGMMGYQTPNINRVAEEGATFTDWYGQQSCTAGARAFITGQNPVRTGLTKVGMPGADVGLQKETRRSPSCSSRSATPPASSARTTLATRTSSCRRARLRRVLRQPLSPERRRRARSCPDYPKDPRFKKKFGPRGVLHCVADGKGGQTIKDTGPLTKKRMETIDEEITARARLDGEAGQGG
jgi:arylsulfatase